MEISVQQTLAIETKKIQLIQMISQVYNSELLREIENILLSSKTDWWNSISNSEKKAIQEGLDDYKNGKLLSHDEVTARVKSKVAYSIRWTQKANSDYLEVIDYLKINWGNRSAEKFIDKVEKQIGLIQEMPNLYPATGFFKGLRRCVLVKQI